MAFTNHREVKLWFRSWMLPWTRIKLPLLPRPLLRQILKCCGVRYWEAFLNISPMAWGIVMALL